jgi:RNA polymerase subunit RPABC4/transcription elongation factor Spt4
MLECSQCGEIFETEPSFCPACGAIVRADATTCTKCNETFWSPIHPPKIPAEGEEKKEETVEGQEVSGEVATTSS